MILATSSLESISYTFLSILFEGAPFILFGTIVSGFIDAYLPARSIERILPKNRPLAIVVSAFLGIILPVCECAVVPVIRRLVRKGLPVSCAITYMLAAPIVNPITFISTMTAFSRRSDEYMWYMAGSRVVMAVIVTVIVGLLVHYLFSQTGILKQGVLADKSLGGKSGSNTANAGGSKLLQAMRTAQKDFLDTGMYFVIGVLITSLFINEFSQASLARIADSELDSSLLLMFFAFILSLCSTSDAFVAAQLDAQFSNAARLAFLVFGPMMDVKLVFLYLNVFRLKFVMGLLCGLVVLIATLTLLWPSVDSLFG